MTSAHCPALAEFRVYSVIMRNMGKIRGFLFIIQYFAIYKREFHEGVIMERVAIQNDDISVLANLQAAEAVSYT